MQVDNLEELLDVDIRLSQGKLKIEAHPLFEAILNQLCIAPTFSPGSLVSKVRRGEGEWFFFYNQTFSVALIDSCVNKEGTEYLK